jgi:hypothetical protein
MYPFEYFVEDASKGNNQDNQWKIFRSRDLHPSVETFETQIKAQNARILGEFTILEY